MDAQLYNRTPKCYNRAPKITILKMFKICQKPALQRYIWTSPNIPLDASRHEKGNPPRVATKVQLDVPIVPLARMAFLALTDPMRSIYILNCVMLDMITDR